MPSLRDVARLAGVSVSTASKVLNTRTEIDRIGKQCATRVQEAATRLNYRPNYHARSLLTGKSLSLGVALQIEDGVNVLGESYFGSIIGGIEATARHAGFEMLFMGPAKGLLAAERALDHLHQRRVDGMINVGWLGDESEARLAAESSGGPVVLVGHPRTGPIPRVDVDDAAGITSAVQHLAELQHRSLLWCGPASTADRPYPAASRRKQAFTAAVKQAGIRGSSAEFTIQGRQRDPHATMDGAQTAVGRLLRTPPAFTAIICYNDLVAAGIYRAIFQAHLRVPEDISVIGFDDVCAAYMCPPLTTVSQRLFEMGERAAKMVLAMIADPHSRERYRGKLDLLEPRLVVRGSTAPPPRAQAVNEPRAARPGVERRKQT